MRIRDPGWKKFGSGIRKRKKSDPGSDIRHPGSCIVPIRPGDGRVNEQPGLTVFHTVWMREHNRSAHGQSVTHGVRPPKFIWAPVLSETQQLPPPPPLHLGLYTRAISVSQDRRHLFVTP